MKTIKIGRSSSNDFVINDPVVSSSHALITVSDFGEVTIEDLGSSNGTYVNGQKVKKAVLTSSSTVLLGNHSIDWKQIIQKSKTKLPPPKPPVDIPQDVVEKKLIGRSPFAQIRFSHDSVSEKHAYICKKSNGDVVLVDINSTNGTYVNGNKITSPYVLRAGDTVTLSNRYPLNWEAIYPKKVIIGYKPILAIVASIAIILGIVLPDWNEIINTGGSFEKVFKDHKHDVAMIYVKSTYAVTVNGRPLSSYLNGQDVLDYCYIDGNNQLASGLQTSSGTGFFVSPDGKMLTNNHVVGSTKDDLQKETIIKGIIQSLLSEKGYHNIAPYIEVKYRVVSVGIVQNDTYIESEKDLIPCTVLKTSDDENLDVAILQTNTKVLPNGSTYIDLKKTVPSDKLKLGYEVCTIGFPRSLIIGQTSVGLEANNQSGTITQERGSLEYGHNIPILPGASGSPVYDKRGRFAGIIVSGFLGLGDAYNHAIHPAPVIEFVNKSF